MTGEYTVAQMKRQQYLTGRMHERRARIVKKAKAKNEARPWRTGWPGQAASGTHPRATASPWHTNGGGPYLVKFTR